MLLAISTTHGSARDLHYLLRKNSTVINTGNVTLSVALIFHPVATKGCKPIPSLAKNRI